MDLARVRISRPRLQVAISPSPLGPAAIDSDGVSTLLPSPTPVPPVPAPVVAPTSSESESGGGGQSAPVGGPPLQGGPPVNVGVLPSGHTHPDPAAAAPSAGSGAGAGVGVLVPPAPPSSPAAAADADESSTFEPLESKHGHHRSYLTVPAAVVSSTISPSPQLSYRPRHSSTLTSPPSLAGPKQPIVNGAASCT
jgi:hypothetical protein